jgi:hypothetical protein
MRTYVITTGVLFGVLTLAHLMRIVTESRALAGDPWYVLITLLTAVLCVWAWRVFRSLPREADAKRQ